MSTHKHIDKICCVLTAFTLLLTVLFMNGEKLGIREVSAMAQGALELFDTSRVHTIDIVMDDWEEFLDGCMSEEYSVCTVVIDNEACRNVAIRAKGNTSLTQVEAYGNDRYSFKIEFDRYDSANTYHGLDKLCLNNIIQDNTYMKDYLTYRMMGEFGVAAPLCSYVFVTVNGEDWGLYLAVEGVEDYFLQRNYGISHGDLYKPDSLSMGGGRGNGREFNMEEMEDFFDGQQEDMPEREAWQEDAPKGEAWQEDMPGGGMPQGDTAQDDRQRGHMRQNGGPGGPGGMSMGSDDVKLIYTDDDYESYSNIFDNAKTDITDSDRDSLIASLKSLNANEDIEEVVDIDAVLRYFVVHNFVLNFDSYTGSMIHNYYLYVEDGRMSMIPWDYNLAFGGFQSEADARGLVNYPIDSPVSGGTVESRPMLAWIFANEEYTELYHQYFSEFISDYFESGYFEEMMDNVRELISPYVEKDPTGFCTYEEFETGIETLKEFCLLRAESVRGQIDGVIASTSETQLENSDSMVDAGDIVISDMGAMHNGMGHDRGERNKGGMGGPPESPPDGREEDDRPEAFRRF